MSDGRDDWIILGWKFLVVGTKSKKDWRYWSCNCLE